MHNCEEIEFHYVLTISVGVPNVGPLGLMFNQRHVEQDPVDAVYVAEDRVYVCPLYSILTNVVLLFEILVAFKQKYKSSPLLEMLGSV